jgi:arylsulfatase A-like enzyme
MQPRAAILVSALAPVLSATWGCAADERPNVLLLSLDSVRADYVGTEVRPRPGAPGVPVTPAFDRIARGGVLFENAVTTTSWTLPSHVALVTGLPDPLHGVVDNEKAIDPALLTLAELLQGNGWRTAGFYSGPYLNPLFGFGQGFEHYVNCGSEVPVDVFESSELGRWKEVHRMSHETITSPRLTDEAEAWIRERAERGEPFFAMVHWWDPHYDYVAPAEVEELFDTGYGGDWTGVRGSDRRQSVSPDDVAHIRALYCAEIRYTDDHIGRLLDLLDELGIADDTLVVFTSDHGEEFYERDRWGHQRTLFDEVLEIPLAMRLPGRVPAGVRARGQARIQDVYATVADLLGVEAPPYVTAESLRVLWEDPDHEGFEQPLSLVVPHRDIEWSGLRSLDAKLVWDHAARRGSFWNLERDPGENSVREFGEDDLAASDHPAIARLREWLATVDEERARIPSTPGHEGIELTPELLQELEAVGYLGGDEDD